MDPDSTQGSPNSIHSSHAPLRKVSNNEIAEDQTNATNLRTRCYRSRITLTWQEKAELDDVSNKKVLKKLQFSTLFEGPFKQLSDWPHFFDPDKEDYGKEIQDGLVQLWSNFIVVEALLASVAIQPFISATNLNGHSLEVYGALWMVALLSDFVGLAVTSLFLGYLLASPGKLTWVWLCKIGAWRGIPAVLILWATFMSFVAIGFSSWSLYGKWVGIMCVVIEGIIVAFGNFTAHCLYKATLDTCCKEVADNPAP